MDKNQDDPGSDEENSPPTINLTPRDKPHTSKDKEINIRPIIHNNSSNSLSENATPSQRVQFILGEEDNGEKDKPHSVFCELQEIREVGQGDGKEVVWRETARWVKFEEDVAEEGDRWTKPHVATLSLHSLFELRKGLMTGSMLLDLDADDLPMIFDMIIEDLVASGQLEADKAEKVHELLMKKHQHQFEHHKNRKNIKYIKSLAEMGRSLSRGSNMDEDCKENTKGSLDTLDSGHGSSGSNGELDRRVNFGNMPKRDSKSKLSATDLSRDSKPKISDLFRRDSTTKLTDFLRKDSSVSLGGIDQQRFNEHFAKKIAPGTQAANILVGETDLVNTPTVAYVRLSEGKLLGHMTEVAVPTRFIFIMLGPKGHQKKCHEIGRAIATLMCDEIFHDVAYLAKTRDDLLAGLDEFLDQVTVLPPGEWDPSIKIEPPKAVPSQEARKIISHPDLQSALQNGEATKDFQEKEEVEEEHGDPTLVRTGRLFGGLIQDIKRKAPFYLSDFKDALHVQCLASTIFMYFACLTPIVTFGGLLGSATDNYMGAMESLVSGFVCGISYHLLAGQPLTIIGSTGPILVFETIVYEFCVDQGLIYLTFRFWIGIWVFVILMVMIAFDLSALVRYITRFTEEAFAVLIALIFIVEAFKKLFHILDERPVNMNPNDLLNYGCMCLNNLTHGDDANLTMPSSNHSIWTDPNVTDTFNNSDYIDLERYGNSHYITLGERCEHHHGSPVGPGCDTVIYYPDVFFFSYIVFFKTFCIAFFLKMFRNTRFLPNKVRSLVSDFSVTIAIGVMVTVDVCVGFETPKLLVPESFKPTRDDRGWVVDPTSNPIWSVFAAIGFAILATILIFMDQQITAVIVNRKEHKLKKGSGYHLDLTLIAIQIAICSVLGTPWFVAATVLSINHVRSLTVESECAAPGEKPKFLGVREQRVTGTLAFVMVGLSVLMGKILKYVPLPVLFGVFLYMGVASLSGLQLIQRIFIIFMPAKYQPDYPFLEHVPLPRVHLFTFIQILCLALLWVIKSVKEISIIFPLMVLAMCFIRKLLDWVFTNHEMKWLDDIMPITHRQKKKKDQKQQLKDFVEGKPMERDASLEFTGGIVNIPLNEGERIALPVEKLVYKPDNDDDMETDESGDKPRERKISLGGRERKISVGGRERKNSTGTRERRFSGSSPAQRKVSINQGDGIELSGGAVKIPLEGGKTINVPVDKVTYDPNKNELNISEEMAKTTIWKQLVANEMESGLKLRKRNEERKPVGNAKSVTIDMDTRI